MITIDIHLGGAWRFSDAFEETKHPRGRSGPHGGEFVKKGTSSGSSTPHEPTQTVGGKRQTVSGGELPPHIAKLRIPPAWTNVTYSPDPNAKLLVTGQDAKGRRQAIYSLQHSAAAAESKFKRIQELAVRFSAIQQKNEALRKSPDKTVAAAADCAALIMATGIRPGSESDTGAEKQAYGATTLEGKHVVQTPEGVRLQFTGKKGVALNLPVADKSLASMLLRRKARAGDNGQLFPISERALLDHTKSIGGFRTKDFRTLVGTRTAIAEVAKLPPPKDEKSYKKQVMSVAKVVAQKLGNTPTIALQSYINPVVFADWRMSSAGGQHA